MERGPRPGYIGGRRGVGPDRLAQSDLAGGGRPIRSPPRLRHGRLDECACGRRRDRRGPPLVEPRPRIRESEFHERLRLLRNEPRPGRVRDHEPQRVRVRSVRLLHGVRGLRADPLVQHLADFESDGRMDQRDRVRCEHRRPDCRGHRHRAGRRDDPAVRRLERDGILLPHRPDGQRGALGERPRVCADLDVDVRVVGGTCATASREPVSPGSS